LAVHHLDELGHVTGGGVGAMPGLDST
jgi:hypothetical protein